MNQVSIGYNPRTPLSLNNDLYKLNSWERLNLFAQKHLHAEEIFRQVCKVEVGSPTVGDLSFFKSTLMPLLHTLAKDCDSQKTLQATAKMLSAVQKLNGSPAASKISLYRFLRQWTRKFIPIKLLGDQKNSSAFAKNLRFILTRGKRGTVPLQIVLRGLDLERIAWTKKSKDLKAKQMLAKLVKFLTEKVIWRLIKSFYHVTDTSWGKNELFFYQKRHFQSSLDHALIHLQKRGVLKLLDSQNKVKSVHEMWSAPALAKARLMPKHSGFRLISWKKDLSGEKMLLFRKLLFHLKKRYSESIDVRGRDLYKIWTGFVRKLQPGEEVFFVKTDIKDAFPSVNLKQLESVLENVGDKSPPTLYVYKLVYRTGDGRKIVKHIVKESEQKNPAEIPKNCTLDLYIQTNVLDVKDSLKEIGKRSQLQTIKFDIGRKSRIFLQTQGLLQGDSLSSSLCDIYYGHMVKKDLVPKLDIPKDCQNILVRAMDDFFFASTDEALVSRFWEKIQCGFPDYNCSFRKEKSVTNLTTKMNSNQKLNDVSFCGISLNCFTFRARPNLSPYLGQRIVSSLKFNLESSSTEQEFILKKVLFTCTLKIDPIFLDERLNSKELVLENLWNLFYLTACRFDCMVDSIWSLSVTDCERGRNVKEEQFVLTVISQSVKKVWSAICRSRRQMTSSISCSSLKLFEIRWLLTRAFYIKIRQRHHFYGNNLCKKLDGLVKKYHFFMKEKSDSYSDWEACLELGQLKSVSSKGLGLF